MLTTCYLSRGACLSLCSDRVVVHSAELLLVLWAAAVQGHGSMSMATAGNGGGLKILDACALSSVSTLALLVQT